MPIADYSPSVQQVADLVLAYTKGKYSAEGTFNENTEPTGDQVTRMIASVAAGLGVRIGPDLPYADAEAGTAERRTYDLLTTAAKDSIALIVAARIARSLRPEQVDSSAKDVAASLRAEAEDQLTALLEGVNEARGGSGEAGESVAVTDSAATMADFPEDAGGLIGWETRF